MGQFASQENQPSRIHSTEVGTINAVEDMKKLLTQDMLGVKPTELCTCSDNDLKENKFIKSITKSTHKWAGPSANAVERRGSTKRE